MTLDVLPHDVPHNHRDKETYKGKSAHESVSLAASAMLMSSFAMVRRKSGQLLMFDFLFTLLYTPQTDLAGHPELSQR